jgi:hypothetical protein
MSKTKQNKKATANGQVSGRPCNSVFQLSGISLDCANLAACDLAKHESVNARP